ESLSRNIVLLEEELDAAEKNIKETSVLDRVSRLRQVDVKAEHFERQVQRVVQERDQWEKKYEASATCASHGIASHYNGAQGELDELVKNMEG
ncbi:hypothetical protein V8E55_005660, partial [Tylopilus felleus]